MKVLGSKKSIISVSVAALLLSGCVSTDKIALYSESRAGFATVAEKTRIATGGKQTVWIQNQAQNRDVFKRVHALTQNKMISGDTAVQVALLNNRELQAAYTDIGLGAADVWQQALPTNPKASLSIMGIGSPDLGLFRTLEGMISNNIFAIITQDRRVDLADSKFRQAQLKAAFETLTLATSTRKAWIKAVSSTEMVTYLERAKVTSDSAAQLALKLGESGAMPKVGQAREFAFDAELAGQLASARLQAKLAKEELSQVMGLWGAEIDYLIPNALPPLPKSPILKDRIEKEALMRRVDLQVSKLDLEITAKSFGLTQATRYVTDLDLSAGLGAERGIDTKYELNGGNLVENSKVNTPITPQFQANFTIPIFDSGKARMRMAELSYMKSANLLAAKAVNVRAEARQAYISYRSNYDIARHYRDTVLPLRKKVEEEAVLTYNGMISNTFELLTDTRNKINAELAANTAKRDFWMSDAELTSAIYGGGRGMMKTTESATATGQSGGN